MFIKAETRSVSVITWQWWLEQLADALNLMQYFMPATTCTNKSTDVKTLTTFAAPGHSIFH